MQQLEIDFSTPSEPVQEQENGRLTKEQARYHIDRIKHLMRRSTTLSNDGWKIKTLKSKKIGEYGIVLVLENRYTHQVFERWLHDAIAVGLLLYTLATLDAGLVVPLRIGYQAYLSKQDCTHCKEHCPER